MVVYRIEFTNFEGQLVIATIADTTTSGAIVYTDLDGIQLKRRTIDNNEDKFTPIRPLELTLTFRSTPTVNVNTFSSGDDNRFLVQVGINGEGYFTGYLSMDDLREPHFDSPNEVTLIATDNLGILKTEPLLNFLDVTPKGYINIISFIAYCLDRTGPTILPIYISWNLVGLGGTLPIWEELFLHSKTFEDEIGTCINCYETLERILGNSCYLHQRKASWYIQSVDEMEDTAQTFYIVDPVGTISLNYPLNPITENNLVSVGSTESIRFINEDQIVGPRRVQKEAKITFHYETPIEIIDNINFERGTLFNTTGLTKKYTIENWATGKNFPNVGSPVTAPYIRRLFDSNAYEIERDVVLPAGSTSGNTEYIISNPIAITFQDKFNISFDYRFETNFSGTGQTSDLIALIYVKSGSTVYSLEEDGSWKLGYDAYRHQYPRSTTDESKWMNISVEAQPIPITGELFVCLLKSSVYGTSNNTHFANLNFEYIPLLNGIYHRLNGHYNKMSTVSNNKAKIEDEVFINNSPKPLFKGTLFRDIGSGVMFLVNNVSNSWRDPSPIQTVPFGKDQAISVWNQYNRPMTVIEGSMQGLNSATQVPDCIDKYQFTDSNVNVDNKIFMCVSFEQDLFSCEWKGTFIEVFDTVIGKTGAGDTHEFKHIEGD